MRKPWKLLSVSLFLIALLVGGLFGNRLLALTDATRNSLKTYTQLITTAHDRYGTQVSYKDLVFASIRGMIRTLDPHTTFFSAQDYANMRERQQSSFYGLGILIGMRNNQLTVVAPIEGTPASRLGIRAGDVISTIEGEPTDRMGLDEAIDKLKGPKGTKVHITIVRPGLEAPLSLTVTRAEIPQTTVRYAFMIAPDTGYILFTDFAHGSSHEMAQAIAKLKKEGMKRLLLDIRNNGGGLLDQAIAIADQFIPKGAKIVETRGRTPDSFQTYSAAGNYPPFGLPLVVLVNSGTASAAEILSGAIQDHDMGLIAGTTTWGKGLVQTLYSLSYGNGLALTTAKYYTPSGRLIQRDYSSWYEYYNHTDRNEPTTPPAPPPGTKVFKTDLGRKVYGGGGITPDVIIDPKPIAPFLQYLLAHNAFFDYAVQWANQHPKVDPTWKPDAAVMADFGTWLEKKKLATDKEVSKAYGASDTKGYIERQIEAEIANAEFGSEARFKILADGDSQIEAALKLFPQASHLLAERLDLNKKKPGATETTAALQKQ